MPERHHVLDHPLAADALVGLRDPTTAPERFRALTRQLATLLAVEAARSLPTEVVDAPTPLGIARGRRVATWPVLVPILRAGLGLLDAVVGLVPGATVALVGVRRDEATLLPERYCDTLPADLAGRPAWVLDPMLATGGTLVEVCGLLAARGAGPVTALCLLAAPQGAAHLADRCPDVRLHCAGLDDDLDARGFIVPGLGDAGDRLFGVA